MPHERRYKVFNVVSILEDDVEFTEATMFISPPEDQHCSDKDSADGEGGSADKLHW